MIMTIIFVFLIVLYLSSIFGCIEPLVSRDIELNFPVILLVLCPILNTIIALRDAKWSDVKRIFKSKNASKASDWR